MAGLVIGGAIAAAFTAGWASMWPTNQLYGRTFTGLARGSRQIAFTFDDGPNDPYTLRLLDVLARHQVHATFFMIGAQVAKRPDIARAVVAAGHEIGNHTQTHPNLIFCSPVEVRRQIGDCSRATEDAIGRAVPYFRPPYGGRRPDVLRAAREAGLSTIMWRASSNDWKLPSAEAIEQRVLRQIGGGEIVLMHDGAPEGQNADRSRTIAAVERLIGRLRADGREFVSVGEMLNPPQTHKETKNI
jgi:peptidoglycan-N-acetylglucosamine deacetylase